MRLVVVFFQPLCGFFTGVIMDYIHVKNLEKYHPGYKDRELKWFKCYFRMVNADPDFELLCEVDKWRFVALVMLELQNQNPLPIDDKYFVRKGFDVKKRRMSLTLQMLHNSVDIVTGEDYKPVIEGMGCIYFLQIATKKMIKIGFTKHLQIRIKEIEKHSGENLEFLYAHKGTIQLENTYHQKFKQYQIAPEWYKVMQVIFSFIQELRQDPAIIDVTESYDSRNPGVTQSKSKSKIRIEEEKDILQTFNTARKLYPGTKRGNPTEFENFVKKHKDWRQVLPLLKEAVKKQIKWRTEAGGEFRPPWKNFSTWINQRCWEDEVVVGDSGLCLVCGTVATRWTTIDGKDIYFCSDEHKP